MPEVPDQGDADFRGGLGSRRPTPVCAYCENPACPTSDHVPPKAIFPDLPEFRQNLITVPACLHCNSRHSGDDTFLLLLLGGLPSGSVWSNHPGSEEITARRIRALERAPEELKSWFPEGKLRLYEGQDLKRFAERLNRVMRDQIRALYFRVHGRRPDILDRVAALPIEDALKTQPAIQKQFRAALAELNAATPTVLGGGAFAFRHAPSTDPVGAYGFLLEFYGQMKWIGVVAPQSTPIGMCGFGQEMGGRMYSFRNSTRSHGPLGELIPPDQRKAPASPSMYIERQRFKHERIDIDDHHYHECEFLGCHMVYSGGVPPYFTGECVMDNVRFEFADAAERTIHMLGRLATDPGTEGFVRAIYETAIEAGRKRRGRNEQA